jgi:hypothetical protein
MLHAANHSVQLSAAIGFNGVDHLQGHGYANELAWMSVQPVLLEELWAGGRLGWKNEVTSSGTLKRLLLPLAGYRVGWEIFVRIRRTTILRLAGCEICTNKYLILDERSTANLSP